MDATGAVAEMLGRCAASEMFVVARPDSRGVRHYAKYACKLELAGATVWEYCHEKLVQMFL
jgi:GH18 family chitinase